MTLWSPETPRLYTVRTTLDGPGGTHAREVRTGFREAEFRPGGFYLNGERRQLLGLNRHQLFPYLGMAAPARLQRRDAEILRRDLNCDMVRCSHYPQSPHFLDACDELGLLVWAEIPGWQYVGGPGFRDIVAPQRRGHGHPRPQSPVGHHLGHPAQRERQRDRPVRSRRGRSPASWMAHGRPAAR